MRAELDLSNSEHRHMDFKSTMAVGHVSHSGQTLTNLNIPPFWIGNLEGWVVVCLCALRADSCAD